MTTMTPAMKTAMKKLIALGGPFSMNFRFGNAYNAVGSADVTVATFGKLQAAGLVTWNAETCRWSIK